MENNNSLIKLNKITYKKNERTILNSLYFTMRKNDKIGIVGDIGTGKTTLLKIIMGLISPTQGEIKIFNQERTSEKNFIEVRRKIGFLFQNSEDQLFCPTVIEEISFGPLNLRYDEKKVSLIVNNIIKKLNIEKYKDRISYNLSYGEKKIIAFASILAMTPEILLLDEPFNGLDKKYSKKIIDIITKECDSYIIVSHNQNVLQPLCSKIYNLTPKGILEIS